MLFLYSIRYELESISKLIGGTTLTYAVADQDYGIHHQNKPIPAEQQWQALSLLLNTVSSPSNMHIPDELVKQMLISPFAYTDGGTSESVYILLY